ncbi:hypothetical protein ACTODO_00975 [Schaalia dentiphila ATCC 17982]|uniref:Uncharacterized protein n=1 Tax=Schaalia dentiphila ATCC 17982 TaxID=411466 RepID=A7BBF6_9ACTO|nr:hypothetical protein ACTODO_00975 [Schaalia odontolytica ATCC 17982]
MDSVFIMCLQVHQSGPDDAGFCVGQRRMWGIVQTSYWTVRFAYQD